MSRPTRSGIVSVIGHCHDCDFSVESKNGLGLAAQHHDRTGHAITVETTTAVTYGERSERPKK